MILYIVGRIEMLALLFPAHPTEFFCGRSLHEQKMRTEQRRTPMLFLTDKNRPC